MVWLMLVILAGGLLMVFAVPVKEREYPVGCRSCGRPTWSMHGECVYCRLGWPDPNELRPPITIGRGVPGPEGRLDELDELPGKQRRHDCPNCGLPRAAESVAGGRVAETICPRCGLSLHE